MKNNKIVLQIPLEGAICGAFDIAFNNSGFESRTEYIRSLIMKDYNSIAVHYSECGSEPESYIISHVEIKD